jgi:hypothetical protein
VCARREARAQVLILGALVLPLRFAERKGAGLPSVAEAGPARARLSRSRESGSPGRDGSGRSVAWIATAERVTNATRGSPMRPVSTRVPDASSRSAGSRFQG